MINQKKVELMTRMAMYEHTKKISVRHQKYFEKKYKYVIALRSIVTGLAIGVLIAFLIFAAKYYSVIEFYEVYGAPLAVASAVLCIVIIAGLYVTASIFILGRKFDNMRGGYVKYKLYQRELSKINDEE